MAYIYIIIATLGIAGNFLIQKLYQKKYCRTFAAVVSMPLIMACFNFIFYFIINGFKINFGAFSVKMALLYALFTTFDTVVGIVIMKYCSMALFSMFIMMGGMFLPFIVGAVFLDEPVGAFRIVAMVLLISGLVTISVGKDESRISKKGLVLCIAVFLVNGCVSTVTKLHQISAEALSATDYLMWGTVWTFVLTSILNIVVQKRINKTASTDKVNVKDKVHMLILILLMVVVSSTGGICNVTGAKTIDAGMLYPMTTGGSVVIMTVFGALLFKEKLSKRVIVGVTLSVAATILFAF